MTAFDVHGNNVIILTFTCCRCYGMALKQQPDLSFLWHDLGIAYWRHSIVLHAEYSDPTQRKTLAAKGLQAMQKAVALQPKNAAHWNALGIIAAGKLQYWIPLHSIHCNCAN
jgi:hypothetical protein